MHRGDTISLATFNTLLTNPSSTCATCFHALTQVNTDTPWQQAPTKYHHSPIQSTPPPHFTQTAIDVSANHQRKSPLPPPPSAHFSDPPLSASAVSACLLSPRLRSSPTVSPSERRGPTIARVAAAAAPSTCPSRPAARDCRPRGSAVLPRAALSPRGPRTAPLPLGRRGAASASRPGGVQRRGGRWGWGRRKGGLRGMEERC